MRSLAFTLCYLFLSVSLYAQTIADSKSLPRASLDEWFPATVAESFLNAIQEKKFDLHSVMILKEGKVVYERWFGNNAPDKNHVMWSVSKTWATIAVGFAIAEGKFTVEDRVISFFPDDLPDDVSENLTALRVKDLLTMSVGFDTDPTMTIWRVRRNWEKYFLAQPIPHKPGTKFVYNSLATYMLSSIVRKTTGENLIDYLQPRLFEPLGIEGARWDSNLDGTNFGGWGLFVKTEDMAKLGQFLLQKGKWDGKQLLPEAWIEEATTSKILQKPDVDPAKSNSDWEQGYCYQIWRCRHNGFRADGMNGQYIVVLPEQQAVVIFTANIGDGQAQLNLVWEHLLPALK
jgi:CubicO group peptidase (beta-lactamase class C family)